MKWLDLATWASRRFEKPPCAKTLRRWASEGKIHPPPTRPGKAYLVHPDADVVGADPLPHGRLVDRV